MSSLFGGGLREGRRNTWLGWFGRGGFSSGDDCLLGQCFPWLPLDNPHISNSDYTYFIAPHYGDLLSGGDPKNDADLILQYRNRRERCDIDTGGYVGPRGVYPSIFSIYSIMMCFHRKKVPVVSPRTRSVRPWDGFRVFSTKQVIQIKV